MVVALGLNIIYGLKPGDELGPRSFFALGAYFGYTLVEAGGNYFLALALAPVGVGLVGLVMERTLITPMRDRPMVYTLILTYGLMFVIDGLIKSEWLWGVETLNIPPGPSSCCTRCPWPGSYPVSAVIWCTLGLIGFRLLGRTRWASTCGGRTSRKWSRPGNQPAGGADQRFRAGLHPGRGGRMLAGPIFTVFPLMGHEMLIKSFGWWASAGWAAGGPVLGACSSGFGKHCKFLLGPSSGHCASGYIDVGPGFGLLGGRNPGERGNIWVSLGTQGASRGPPLNGDTARRQGTLGPGEGGGGPPNPGVVRPPG